MNGDIYTEIGRALKEFESLESVTSLTIAMAFLQESGVHWIRNMSSKFHLERTQITVYLSDAFASNNPSNLLIALHDISTVHIIVTPKLHAKLIHANDDKNNSLVFIGSANLTKSGIENNLEICTILRNPPIDKLTGFLLSCARYAHPLTNSIIQKYQNLDTLMENQSGSGIRFEDLTRSIFTELNPIPINPRELDDFFFIYDDYEVFFPQNIKEDHPNLNARRDRVHEKLMRLHHSIKPVANSLDLHEHKNQAHITSSVRPAAYTGWQLTWIGLRYGKHADVVEKYTPAKMNPWDRLEYGFHKHACIQLAVHAGGVTISLFHAVRDAAWDRAYVYDKLWDMTFRAEVLNELKKLKGHGYVWTIDNPFSGISKGDFSIDERDLNEFFSYYLQDENGFESSLHRTWHHTSPELRTEDRIVDLAREHFALLEPIYRKLAQTV